MTGRPFFLTLAAVSLFGALTSPGKLPEVVVFASGAAWGWAMLRG